MGLDMYLNLNLSVSSYSKNEQNIYECFKNILQDVDERLGKEGVNVSTEVGYWRKANHIHKWFVDNVQSGKDDCGSYYVPVEKLMELKELCEKVLENPDDGEDYLPTASGFFFGGTSYDEYYLEGIKRTIDIIDEAIDIVTKMKEKGMYASIEYESSW